MKKSKTIKHVKIQKEIKKMIVSGALKPGDKLASEAEFMARHGVSSITVRKALVNLAEEGLIKRIQGKGSFVAETQEGHASGLIAVIMPYSLEPDISHLVILQGIQRQLSGDNYTLITEWYEKGVESEKQAIQRVIERKVDGLLIYPNAPEEDMELYLNVSKMGIPHVWLDRNHFLIEGSFVGSDNYRGGLLAVQHLVDLGHREIVFFEHEFGLSSERERYAGFNHILDKHGLTAGRRYALDEKRENNVALLCARIQSGEITGIFCANDKVALHIIHLMQNEGVNVPQDVSVVGFDNWEGLKFMSQRLTTIQQDFMALGMMSAKLLVDMINNGGLPTPLKYVTPVSLIAGDTTAALRSNR